MTDTNDEDDQKSDVEAVFVIANVSSRPHSSCK